MPRQEKESTFRLPPKKNRLQRATLQYGEIIQKTTSDMFSKVTDPLDKYFELNKKTKEIEITKNQK